MKYIIYEIVQPSHLKEIDNDDYFPKIVNRSVLQKLDVYDVEKEHSSMESAMLEIENKKKLLKNLTLTVIPVISISYDGQIF